MSGAGCGELFYSKLLGFLCTLRCEPDLAAAKKASARISQFRACLQRISDEPGRQSGANVLSSHLVAKSNEIVALFVRCQKFRFR